MILRSSFQYTRSSTSQYLVLLYYSMAAVLFTSCCWSGSRNCSGAGKSLARAWTVTTTVTPSRCLSHMVAGMRGGTGSSSSGSSSSSSSATPTNVGSLSPWRPSAGSSPAVTTSTATATPTPATRLYATTPFQASTSSNNSNSEATLSQKAELLHELALPKLTEKVFGGLTYMDTSSNNNKKDNNSSSSSFFRVLFVLGGPGAGKGTQSALMEEHYPVVHLSVGELLRNEQTNNDSPYQALIQQTLVAGKIVPVEISLQLLEQAMRREQTSKGEQLLYLVDGFPRNDDNLLGWCRVMRDVTALWGVLVYQCPLPVLEERILKRAESSGRSDDNLASLRKRFDTFERETVPIVEKLRKVSETSENAQWSVIDVRGDQSLDDVWLETQGVMNRLVLHDVVTSNVALLEAIRTRNVAAYKKLCDAKWFEEKDAAQVMQEQEGDGNGLDMDKICKAQLDVISGKHVALSYDREMDGQIVREKRIWTHKGQGGWQNIHFARNPNV